MERYVPSDETMFIDIYAAFSTCGLGLDMVNLPAKILTIRRRRKSYSNGLIHSWSLMASKHVKEADVTGCDLKLTTWWLWMQVSLSINSNSTFSSWPLQVVSTVYCIVWQVQVQRQAKNPLFSLYGSLHKNAWTCVAVYATKPVRLSGETRYSFCFSWPVFRPKNSHWVWLGYNTGESCSGTYASRHTAVSGQVRPVVQSSV
jgi:hypothetical protein